MTIANGTRLGPYEVLAPLGAGGMGEVYRAKDTKLTRDVAIKVLPEDFLEGEERKERFEREAKLLAALNHPNIAAIFSFEEIPGSSPSTVRPVLVMELLEGETLRARLAGGALPVRKAVDYGAQIARGLAAAHGKGVVHRDLKPENLFVTKDGRVKILDFGLAKLVEAGAGSGSTNLPTQSKGTEPGAVLGTLGYMSPEQLRGLPADHRTDLFSFGAVLYEMLSGRKAFRGDTAADTVSAILREEPAELSATNRAIPPALERIVRHCLEKSPDERAHSAHDLAFDLESFSTVSSGAAVTPASRIEIRRPSSRTLFAAAVCLGAGVLGGRLLWKKPPDAPPTFHRLTFRRGNVLTARFAPDGRTIVYGAAWGGAPSEIFSVRTESPESRALGLPSATVLSVSSAGELAILSSDGMKDNSGWGTLLRVPLSGGAPRTLLEEVTDADWTPDGKELAVARIGEKGGRRIELPPGRPIYRSDTRIRVLRVSPDGARVAFMDGDAKAILRVVDRSGKSRVLAGPLEVFSARFAWSPSGREVYYYGGRDRKDAALRAVDLSGRVRDVYRTTGTLFVHDVFSDGRMLVEHASSLYGLMFARAGSPAETDLSWFDGSGIVAIAPGGAGILFNESGEAVGGRPQAFFRKADGSPAVRLADGEALALSPDGGRVLIRSGEALAVAPIGAGTPVAVATDSVRALRSAAFFPDGRRILLHGADADGKDRFWVVDPPGPPRPASPPDTSGQAFLMSPDGGSVVAWSAETSVLSILPLGGGPARPLAGTENDDPLGWTADSKSLYVRKNPGQTRTITLLDVATLARRPWRELAPPDPGSVTYAPSVSFARDGSAYAYTYRRVLTSDLYVVEGLK
jgi:eukaryotic-like serine/threonine-protein kinase